MVLDPEMGTQECRDPCNTLSYSKHPKIVKILAVKVLLVFHRNSVFLLEILAIS